MFKNPKTFEDGISDHHQLVSTSLRLNTFRVTQRPSSTEITNILILNLLIMIKWTTEKWKGGQLLFIWKYFSTSPKFTYTCEEENSKV